MIRLVAIAVLLPALIGCATSYAPGREYAGHEYQVDGMAETLHSCTAVRTPDGALAWEACYLDSAGRGDCADGRVFTETSVYVHEKLLCFTAREADGAATAFCGSLH